jgi:hypothetical protein
MRIELTKGNTKTLTSKGKRVERYWDVRVPSFCLAETASGHRIPHPLLQGREDDLVQTRHHARLHPG